MPTAPLRCRRSSDRTLATIKLNKNTQLIRRRPPRVLFWHRLLAASLVLIVVFLVGLLLLARWPKLLIDEVVVEGNEVVRSEELVAASQQFLAGNYFWLLPKRHLWWYPAEGLSHRLLQDFPRLSAVSLNGEWPSRLNLRVSERTPQLIYCEFLNRCYFIDQTGLAYAGSPRFSAGVFLEWRAGSSTPMITAPRQLLTSAELSRILKLRELLLKALVLAKWPVGGIDYFTAGEAGDLIFTVRGKGLLSWDWEIWVDEETAPAILADNLYTAVTAIKNDDASTTPIVRYVDLRFGKKVFYKL